MALNSVPGKSFSLEVTSKRFPAKEAIYLLGFSLSEEELINLLQNFSTGKTLKLSNNLPNNEETENQQDRNKENSDSSFLSEIYSQDDILQNIPRKRCLEL